MKIAYKVNCLLERRYQYSIKAIKKRNMKSTLPFLRNYFIVVIGTVMDHLITLCC